MEASYCTERTGWIGSIVESGSGLEGRGVLIFKEPGSREPNVPEAERGMKLPKSSLYSEEQDSQLVHKPFPVGMTAEKVTFSVLSLESEGRMIKCLQPGALLGLETWLPGFLAG